MIIELKDLTVTQDGFRNSKQITDMISHVSNGGVFDLASMNGYAKYNKLISIVRFEDGRMFIHDGHHRIASIYLGGRSYLSEKEFIIKDWKYSDYMSANLDAGWITPFNPRTHIRVYDYRQYKSDVQVWLKHSREGAEEYIKQQHHYETYLKPRMVLTIQDLLRYI